MIYFDLGGLDVGDYWVKGEVSDGVYENGFLEGGVVMCFVFEVDWCFYVYEG